MFWDVKICITIVAILFSVTIEAQKSHVSLHVCT